MLFLSNIDRSLDRCVGDGI